MLIAGEFCMVQNEKMVNIINQGRITYSNYLLGPYTPILVPSSGLLHFDREHIVEQCIKSNQICNIYEIFLNTKYCIVVICPQEFTNNNAIQFNEWEESC